jgi:hypothetical protein
MRPNVKNSDTIRRNHKTMAKRERQISGQRRKQEEKSHKEFEFDEDKRE